MPLITTKIDNCKFPSGYLYDTQNFTWADLNSGDKKTESKSESVIVIVGLMPVLSYIAGKIQKIKLKSEGEIINKGKSLGTIESLSYFGVIRSPLSGKIVEINKDLLYNPKLVNDSPFEYGWIAKIKPFDDENFESLQSIDQCKPEISSLIKSMTLGR